jgi:hypothetical protein
MRPPIRGSSRWRADEVSNGSNGDEESILDEASSGSPGGGSCGDGAKKSGGWQRWPPPALPPLGFVAGSAAPLGRAGCPRNAASVMRGELRAYAGLPSGLPAKPALLATIVIFPCTSRFLPHKAQRHSPTRIRRLLKRIRRVGSCHIVYFCSCGRKCSAYENI